ncbi:MAG: helix-turn-helix transcriptional regulator [Chitinophagaceae bacterium]|nr:helix-turn-helix transcriptional regulator [Chitinophagaceae bacterium]
MKTDFGLVNKTRDKAYLISFGKRVKSLRNAKGMTLEAIAFEADIELSQVHRIEKGQINPTLTTLKLLAAALNISISELVNFSGEDGSPES